MKFLFAHTNRETNSPSYCNFQLNDKGELLISVRSPGAQVPSLCVLQADEIARLAAALVPGVQEG